MPTGQGGGGNITIYGENLNRTASVNGIEIDLRINGNHIVYGYTPVTFIGLKFGIQYGVVVYWYGNNYIRYINDTNTGIDLQRYDLVTLTQAQPTDTLNSMFEYVPPSQAASLNIIAEFPNGTLLGAAQVVNGYDLHSPGMWLTVTPPFQKTPYTGTFTGGSILPFIFFNHETYTVQMTASYCGPWVTNDSGTGPIVYIVWSHWQNDSNTNPVREVTLNGNVTFASVYEQMSNPPCASTTTSSPAAQISSNVASVGFVAVFVAAMAGLCVQGLELKSLGKRLRELF